MLPAEIRALLTSLDLEVRSARAVSPLSSRTRAAYRVDLVDGRVFKARRYKTAARAKRSNAILSELDDHRFTPIIAIRGGVALEDWIEGTSLNRLPADPRLAHRAGTILAALHSRRRAGAHQLPIQRSTARHTSETLERLGRLVGAGIVTPARARVLEDSLVSADPGVSDAGLIHSDFTPANLVRSPKGDLLVVDNENLHVGFIAHDLARSWFAWSASPHPFSAFRQGYLERGGEIPDPPPRYWQLAATVRSADVRAASGAPGALELIARLDRATFGERLDRATFGARLDRATFGARLDRATFGARGKGDV